MKLSKLLTIGKKKLKKQITGNPFELDEAGNLCGCAIGAIALGTGYDPLKKNGQLRLGATNKAYDILNTLIKKCGYTRVSAGEIYYLNDSCELSFAEIADYLRREERRDKVTCS